jgi:hypothetical protein
MQSIFSIKNGIANPPALLDMEDPGQSGQIEHLRLSMAELQIADVRTQVSLSLVTDFENYHVFKPAPYHEGSLYKMLDEVIAWGKALKELRTEEAVNTSLFGSWNEKANDNRKIVHD